LGIGGKGASNGTCYRPPPGGMLIRLCCTVFISTLRRMHPAAKIIVCHLYTSYEHSDALGSNVIREGTLTMLGSTA